MNKTGIMGALVLIVMATYVAADFAQTPLYFTVPMDLSFSLLTMTGGNTYTNSSNTSTVALYPTSETYYFNTTLQTNNSVAPCTGGATPLCQLGNGNRPGWRIENTGNVNISIGAKLNTSISLTGITLCANSTKAANCGGTAQAIACDTAAQLGTLNTTGRIYGSQLSPISLGGICHSLNVSVWATFTSAQVGTSAGTTSLLFNSSAS